MSNRIVVLLLLLKYETGNASVLAKIAELMYGEQSRAEHEVVVKTIQFQRHSQ